MRIAMLMLNAGRGSGEVARQHAAGLIGLGHEVTFMHPRVGDGAPGADNRDIVLPGSVTPVHEYLPSAGADQKAVSQMTWGEVAELLPAYESALAEVIADVDLVLGHHGNLSAIATQRAAGDKPYVLFLHGTGIEPRHHGGYDDRVWAEIEAAIRGAAGLLVTTEYVRDELVLPLVDVPEERFLVLPIGADLQEFHPDATGDVRQQYNLDAPYVICPGALTRVKGPQNVVAACERYADLATTIFIGDGDLRDELTTALAQRGRLLGFVPAEHKAQLINAAALLVAAPEKKEHFGIIYVEALAGGTPVVAYKGGGVESIITPEVGVLTEREPAALGDAVRKLLMDTEDRDRRARRGRLRAAEHFEPKAIIERLERWLRGLA